MYLVDCSYRQVSMHINPRICSYEDLPWSEVAVVSGAPGLAEADMGSKCGSVRSRGLGSKTPHRLQVESLSMAFGVFKHSFTALL